MKRISFVACCMASSLFAANLYNYELTPVVSYAHPNHFQGLDDYKVFGIRIAKNIDQFFLNQIELGFDHSEDINFENKNRIPIGFDTSVIRYYLNLVKDMPITNYLSLYGLVGGGYEDFVRATNDIKDGGFGQAGLGLKLKITDNFALKFEARDLISFNGSNNTLIYTLGFSSGFGKKVVGNEKSANIIQEVKTTTSKQVKISDNVNDENVDRCQNISKGSIIDEFGCEKVIIINLANFAFDSTKIPAKYESKIKEVGVALIKNKDYKVILVGNTDNIGSQEYNQKLSEARADAVSKKLQEIGVSKDRIKVVGFGELKPMNPNTTEENRAKNRNVKAKFWEQ